MSPIQSHLSDSGGSAESWVRRLPVSVGGVHSLGPVTAASMPCTPVIWVGVLVMDVTDSVRPALVSAVRYYDDRLWRSD